MNAEDRFAQLYEIAQIAARKMSNPFVPAEDMTQEAITWLLAHDGRVQRSTLADGTLHVNRIVAEVITSALSPYVHREKKQALGLSAEDDYHYSVKLVELVLPAVFDRNYKPAFLRGDDKVTTTKDPRTADNWTVLVADVTRAVEAVCSREDRKVLFTRSVGHWTWARFGDTYTLSGEHYRLLYADAVRRIVTFLNAGVVEETSEDGEILDDAINGPGETVRAESVVSWDTISRDVYREPDL